MPLRIYVPRLNRAFCLVHKLFCFLLFHSIISISNCVRSPPNPNPAILPARSEEMALPRSPGKQKASGWGSPQCSATKPTNAFVPIPLSFTPAFLAEMSFHLSRVMTSVLSDKLDIFIPLFYISDNLGLLMLPLSI